MKKIIISTLAVVMLCLSVNAATVAYWRLEEGPDGSTHSNNLDGYYVDSSGNGNDMSSWYFPAPVGAVPAAIIPQSELENKIALNFINRSYFFFTNNFMCIATQDKPIDSQDFTGGFTIECAMKTRVTSPGIVVNKDGDDTIPNNPFKLLFAFNNNTFGDNKISYEFLDSDYNVHVLTAPFLYEVDEWYWVACVCNGSEAWLYVKEEADDDYELEAHITDVVDGMVPYSSAWAIGLGTVNGAKIDNFYGSADEVRICDYALEPDQFLAATGGDDVTPVGYWRFEEGTNGIHQSNNDDYYRDSSGNGNHMATDITPVLSVASTDVPFANVPQTGAEDTMSRTFSLAMQNVGTFGAETGGNNIDSMDLDSFTVECMAKYTPGPSLGYAICKDGEPFKNIPGNGAWESTFGIRFMPDNRISSYFCDENTNLVHSFTTFQCTPGEWYRFAFVCVGGTQAFLYVKGEADLNYDIKATMNVTHFPPGLPIVGGMINSSYPWAIGRGMHLGQLQYGFDGNIDEVRISDVDLPPELFLGSVPEPGMILGGIALALLAFRRK